MKVPENFTIKQANKGKTGQGRVAVAYRKNCSVCQFMKHNPDFRLRVMRSKYFNPEGTESLARVVYDYAAPFTVQSVYLHMQRHQQSDMQRGRKKFVADPNNPAHMIPRPKILKAIDSKVGSEARHEIALDEFIEEGFQKLQRREMNITAANYLTAIRIKADIEKSTKDRRLEAAKAFFAGAKPQSE